MIKSAPDHLGKLAALLLLTATPGCGQTAPAMSVEDPRSPLHLVRRIELPDVKGRIDHMALDAGHNRLFVAEYGNGSVDEIDLASGKISGRITGLREPQGVAWLALEQEIAVACGDGSLKFYRGADRREVAAIRLGNDADNLGLDTRTGNLVVGYGSGALAVVDPKIHRVLRKVILKAHPEAFAIVGSRVFVNVPDAHQIAVGDVDSARGTSAWNTGRFAQNYPMAVDATGSRIAVAYRSPGAVAVIDTRSGGTTFTVRICGDADDLYFLADRLAIICGEGAVELVDAGTNHNAIRVSTRRGARTGLLAPDRKTLFVAVPAERAAAEIWQLSFN